MRKTKIINISIPPRIEKMLSDMQKKTDMTRSELIRDMIKFYTQFKKDSKNKFKVIDLSDRDLDKILKMYYELLGCHVKKVIVIGLGIIENKGKVLIGQRKIHDKYVQDLSWVFPGGRMETIDFIKEIKREIKEETNLSIKVCEIVHARLIPDSPEKSVRIVALYFHLKPKSYLLKPGGDLKKLKWVRSTSVCRYFTTSTADEVMNFLGKIS